MLLKSISTTLFTLFIFLTTSLPTHAQNSEYSKEDISKWVADTATDLMSFSFNKLDEKKEEDKKYFTDKGYKSFNNTKFTKYAHKTSSEHQLLLKSKLLCMPVIETTPLSPETEKEYSATWQATFPYDVEFFSPSSQHTETVISTATIALLKENTSPKIIQWTTAPLKKENIESLCSEASRKKAQIKTHKDKIKSLQKTTAELKERLKELNKQKETPEKKEISLWLKGAVAQIFSFDHTNYDKRKNENQQYFTEKGYASFYKAMQRAQMPEMIAHHKQTISTDIHCMPEIEAFLSKDSARKWKALFLMPMRYSSVNSTKTTHLKVTAIISNRKDGTLGIEQWIAMSVHPGRDSVCKEEDRTIFDIKAYNGQIAELQKSIATLEKEVEALEK